ncbi:F-box protein SKIP23-like [Silene latifolia]|uniref:F-box protein SKIP23-like n=1 Tax=Silene latifolia TaxID=37657 RepID=UPI003D76D1CC
MKNRSNPPWEDLPEELLSIIANFLTSNPIDILTFRSICKSWYSSSPPSYPFNLSRILPLTAPYPAYSFDGRFYNQNFGLPIISVTAVFALRCQEQDANRWLMFVDQLTPGKFMIRQPLTKCYYSMPFNFPRSLDVPNVHVDEISRFYNFNFHSEVNKPPSMWSEYVHKVVLNSDESYAITLFHTGQVGSSKLRFPIWEAGEWEDVYSMGGYRELDARIDDIVYHKGKVLGVDRLGRVYDVHFRSFSKTKMIVSSISATSTKRKRLVESNGVLYLVVKEGAHLESVRFRVFELDEYFNEWVEVSWIHDLVFFFGLDFSFSVPPQKLGGAFRENSIAYLEQSFKDHDGGVVDDDVMLFSNLRFGDLRIGVWHMEDPCHGGTIGSYPGYSNVLWPPPAWLWDIDISKRISDLDAALADLLMNAPAKRLKAMSKKQPPPLEQAIVVDDDANKHDIYEIWNAAHRVRVYLNEAKEIHQHLESIKMKNDVSNQQPCTSVNFQDQTESSSRGSNERQGSIYSEEMKLNGILLHLEETTAKLQKVNLLRRSERVQKSTRDDAFTYG